VEEEQQMEERPDQQPVEQLPIIEERQEVAEGMVSYIQNMKFSCENSKFFELG
jgi:hypothetical protein